MIITEVDYKRHAPHVRHVLIQLLGSPDFATIVEQGISLQAHYGQCFASARFLGFNVANARYLRQHGYEMTTEPDQLERIKRNGRMIVLRLMSQLRKQGLITTVRRVRPDQTQGTNVVDFSALWALIMPILQDLIRNKLWTRARRGISRAGRAILIVVTRLDDVVTFGIPPPFLRNNHFK